MTSKVLPIDEDPKVGPPVWGPRSSSTGGQFSGANTPPSTKLRIFKLVGPVRPECAAVKPALWQHLAEEIRWS